jgi:hypothetical protein
MGATVSRAEGPAPLPVGVPPTAAPLLQKVSPKVRAVWRANSKEARGVPLTLLHPRQVDYMELPLPIKYEEIQREALSTCPAAAQAALQQPGGGVP